MAKARDATIGPSVRESSWAATHANAAPRAIPTKGAKGKGMPLPYAATAAASRPAAFPGARLAGPMDPQRLRELLDRVKGGETSVDEAAAGLENPPLPD